MIRFIKRLAQDESGVTAIEYGLIAAGIGVAIITVVNTVGGSLVAIFTTVSLRQLRSSTSHFFIRGPLTPNGLWSAPAGS
jgi:pilus assembly protein Flp/PilA